MEKIENGRLITGIKIARNLSIMGNYMRRDQIFRKPMTIFSIHKEEVNGYLMKMGKEYFMIKVRTLLPGI
jgi:hypothetical protein